MAQSIVKSHLYLFAGSGNLLEDLVVERTLQTAYTDYPSNYRAPSMHLVIAPTIEQTLLSWSREGSGIRAQKEFRPGDLIINPSGCFTRPQWDRDTRFTLVAIKPSSILRVCNELEIPEIEVPKRFHFQNGALDRTIQRLISCFEKKAPALLLAQALENTVIRQTIAECRTDRDGTHQLSKVKLKAIHDHISDRLTETIALNELAIVAGYSASRFLVLFRNATGFSPYQYVMQQRLERARHLLAETRLSLSSIASRCGFSDQSHLIRLFKRHTGITPHQFRK